MAHRHPGFDRRRQLIGSILGAATVVTLLGSVLVLGLGGDEAAPDSTAAGDATTSIGGDSLTSLAAASSRATVPATTARPPTSSPTSLPSTSAPTTTTPSTTDPPTTIAPPTTIPERTTVPETTTAAETTTPTLARLILEDDGLSVVDFGDGVEETVAAVQARLGQATSDSGWVTARGDYGVCPGTAVRVIRWESLRLFFTDGPTDFGEEARHFFYYSQSPAGAEAVIDLTTSAAIRVDSTVDELRQAYGDRLVIESSIPFGVTFYIDANTPGLLSGTLTASSPDGVVTAISGGFGCGS